MAQNSVRWAAFEDQKDEEWIADVRVPIDGKGVRAERIRQWNEKWESFCTWIVEEFGKNEA
jgi:adenosine deaminase CECR1